MDWELLILCIVYALMFFTLGYSTARKKFKALYESQSVGNKKEKKKFKSDCCNAKIIYDEEGLFCDKCGHECRKI